MTQFAEKMELLESVGSRLEKERILREWLPGDEVARQLLVLTLDPFITFGVTVEPDIVTRTSIGVDSVGWWRAIVTTLNMLAKRELTGGSAEVVVRELLADAPTVSDEKWARRVINRNLRAGVQVSTVNKAVPGLIQEFDVALAKPYDPARHELRGEWAVEPKLDGLRMVLIDGVGYTRNGRKVATVDHIIAELTPWSSDFVFDGELMGAGDFDEASGAIRRKSTGTDERITYNIFDMVPRSLWGNPVNESFNVRRMRLLDVRKVLGCGWPDFKGNIRVVDQREFHTTPSTEKLFEARDTFISAGYEGAMLKDCNAHYVFGRSDTVLKLKDFTDADCRIVGSYEGKGRHRGRLGGIIVTDDKGIETKVGSGFSDLQRTDLWSRRDALVGKIVEIQYQNLTKEGVMRFPVFVKFRPDKE